MKNWIGYRWLAEEYGIEPVQPFIIASRIGKTRTTVVSDGITVETHLEVARPASNFSSHLTFALKREGVHLEFLARLFQAIPIETLTEWINREPSGQYARRAGFLFEWLTGKDIEFSGVKVGNYVSALPEDVYFASTESENVKRWRVRNNLPGTPQYCPLVRRTETIQEYEKYDCREKLTELDAEFGVDTLLRSAVWITIKESRASFRIEHEEARVDRIKRFASVMETRCGTVIDPLSPDFLAQIQVEILGDKALRVGPRMSPVFIGETRLGDEIVHYVAPHWDQVNPMLDGLRAFAASTIGGPSLIRSAVISFGFVYIHPMADGNGRISRFLVNDTLRRDGAASAPFILPISATITRNVTNRAGYEQALELFSRPFMSRFAPYCSFGEDVTYLDGIVTNFQFSAYEDAQFAWSYPDLTSQAEYMADAIRETIEVEMRQEASYIFENQQTRARLKDIMEAPDVELDRLIRSIKENNGAISHKLLSEFQVLKDASLRDKIVKAILSEGVSTSQIAAEASEE